MALDADDPGIYPSAMLGLRELREALRLSQAQLAELAGTSQAQISRLESDSRELTRTWAVRLAPHLGVAPENLLFPERNRETQSMHNGDGAIGHMARVVGYVGAASEAHFYAVSESNLDEVAAPPGATLKTVAVEIRGESLGATFDRWLAFYDDVRRPITSDLIGKLCVIGLADDRVVVKKVRRQRDGTFLLESEREAPIEHAEIEWAAPVKALMPK